MSRLAQHIAAAIRDLGSHPEARAGVPGKFVVFWKNGRKTLRVFA